MRQRPSPALIAAALAFGLLVPTGVIADGGKKLSKADVAKLLQTIDDRVRNPGDLKIKTYWKHQIGEQEPRLLEVDIYRRDLDDTLLILYTRPKTQAGRGLLRKGYNAFFYDPGIGKWERVTFRRRLAGTDTRTEDFDQLKLSTNYTAEYVAHEKVGSVPAHHVKLSIKEGAESAYPWLEVWIDARTGHMLKRQDKSESGRLLRTVYFRRWKKFYSASKKQDVYLPSQYVAVDEILKGSRTTVRFAKAETNALPKNLFTKAWLEGRSR